MTSPLPTPRRRLPLPDRGYTLRTSIRPFQCPECGGLLVSLRSLDERLIEIHPFMYECWDCELSMHEADLFGDAGGTPRWHFRF